MNKIKGFLFDLDGVITDTAEYHFFAWKELAQLLGIHLNREFNEELKGISRIESLEKILRFNGVENNFTVEEKIELATKKNDHYLQLIDSITPNDILPEIEMFIVEAKNNGLLIGLTSASQNGPKILEKLNLLHYFDAIVDPSKLKYGKPNPEIFISGAAQLGLSTKECIGFEDALSGIEAINAANMFSVGIGDKELLKNANYVVGSTSELKLPFVLSEYIQQIWSIA